MTSPGFFKHWSSLPLTIKKICSIRVLVKLFFNTGIQNKLDSPLMKLVFLLSDTENLSVEQMVFNMKDGEARLKSQSRILKRRPWSNQIYYATTEVCHAEQHGANSTSNRYGVPLCLLGSAESDCFPESRRDRFLAKNCRGQFTINRSDSLSVIRKNSVEPQTEGHRWLFVSFSSSHIFEKGS